MLYTCILTNAVIGWFHLNTCIGWMDELISSDFTCTTPISL